MKRTPLRRVAVRRAGMAANERVELKRLHTRVVMTRWAQRCGIVEIPNKSGKGSHWEGNCLRCQRWRILFTSHIEPVGRVPKLRYDPDNAVPLCGGCHIHWWHKYPRHAAAWIRETIGDEMVDFLALKADNGERRWPPSGLVRIMLQDELRKAGVES